MENKLLSELNESQRKAVVMCDKSQLIVAGAGSGKTRVLTYKIAYLLEKYQLEPWSILALTFTNKAAREMKERIGRLVGQQRARYLQMGTFHSVFARILRREAHHIGYNSDYTIYDQSDSRSLIKSIIREMQLDEKQYKPASVADRISMAKNHLLLPQAYANSPSAVDDAIRKVPAISKIYYRYVERCRQANAMDFDDLLLLTYVLFREHEGVRLHYLNLFSYILVDEYQDTNIVQKEILKLLYDRNVNKICAVGDDAQSIYSFRGANIDNILGFCNDFEGAQVFLAINYRSTKKIVEAANSLIKKNSFRITEKPAIQSTNDEGEMLTLKPAYSDKEEAQIVCNDIQRIRRSDKCEYSDFAILYRTNSQSRSFEEYMRKENIPYRIYGGLSFYQRKEIKDVIAYFRVVVNPNDEEALKRIINYPTRGIGDTTVTKIVQAANMHGVSLWTVIKQPAVYHLDVNRGTMTKLLAFKQLIDGWIERAKDEDAYTLGHDIITQSGVSKDIYSGKEPEDLSRQENLEEFVGGLQDFVATRREEDMGDAVALTDFLQEVSLLTDLDSDDDDTQPKVVLMTIHSAKGLEFPNVFIVGLEENIFPSPLCVNSLRELEEERRLLYVAITRAEKRCIMTCAQNRWRYGRMEMDTPSRFIKDIDPQLMRIEQNGIPVGRQTFSNRLSPDFDHNGNRFGRASQYVQNARPVATQFKADPKPRIVAPTPSNFKPLKSVDTPSSTFNAQSSTLREGSVIEHQRFGIGEVIKIEGTGENMKATVRFKNTGTKQLLLKFARFTVVE